MFGLNVVSRHAIQRRMFNLQANPYKAKRTWPPDFSKISPKYQFRLERRYRRRVKLKWARPKWTKAVKLAQWGSALLVLAYGVFYLDLGKNGGNELFSKARDKTPASKVGPRQTLAVEGAKQ